jgi:hypothetical protein
VSTIWAVLVFEMHGQFLAQDFPFRIDIDGGGPRDETRVQEQCDVVLANSAVRLQVLALQVGVDRHLDDTPSTNGGYEVDGCCAAVGSDPLDGVGCDIHVHEDRTPHLEDLFRAVAS